jgi:hypothetical protein
MIESLRGVLSTDNGKPEACVVVFDELRVNEAGAAVLLLESTVVISDQHDTILSVRSRNNLFDYGRCSNGDRAGVLIDDHKQIRDMRARAALGVFFPSIAIVSIE